VTGAERSWGSLLGESYAAILHRAYGRDYQPRFAKVGIELVSAPSLPPR
jgi:hypothetical protein